MSLLLLFPSAGGPAPAGILKRWTGSEWATAPLKVWTGSAFDTATLKMWDGELWVVIV